MIQDITSLYNAILECKNVSSSTRGRAEDMLKRLRGEWTWGCINNGVYPVK